MTAMDKMTRDLESLRRTYCPPLDEALFFALALDYDRNDPTQLTQLQNALENLKEGAVEEQELELLPPVASPDAPPSRTGVTREAVTTTSTTSQHPRDDDASLSITTGFSSLGLSDAVSHDHEASLSGYGEAGEAFENLTEVEKVQWLMGMFPGVEKSKVETSLNKCGGQFDRSTDELLNEVFLQDNALQLDAIAEPVSKGVEGFATNDNDRLSKKKSRNRNKQFKNRGPFDSSSNYYSDSAVPSGISTPDPNVWTSLPKDVEFITSRTELKTKLVTSLYHANSAKLALTIRAILQKEAASIARNPGEIEEIIQWQIDELKSYFPHEPDDLIHAALTLTRKSPSAAKELLDVMVTSKETPTLLGKVDGLATYAPLDLSDGVSGMPWSHDIHAWSSTRATNGGHTVSHMDNSHGIAAADAFNQAAAAYKRGKSDRLMGGAAAYYASIGHDHVKAAKASQTQAANAHVAQQSSATTLDLHGVNVSHAIRIAKDATEAWWDDLGDRKYVPVGGVGSGYKIITGVGRHSADGVGRIGPAVSKMLVREGWKVEVGRGEIIVWGKARKK